MARIVAGPAGADLGARLDEAMRERDLTINGLARLLGVDSGFISRIRSGARGQRLSAETLFLLADALEVEARWLLLGQGPKRRGDEHIAVDDTETRRLRDRVARLEEALRQVETAARGALRRSRTRA